MTFTIKLLLCVLSIPIVWWWDKRKPKPLPISREEILNLYPKDFSLPTTLPKSNYPWDLLPPIKVRPPIEVLESELIWSLLKQYKHLSEPTLADMQEIINLATKNSLTIIRRLSSNLIQIDTPFGRKTLKLRYP